MKKAVVVLSDIHIGDNSPTCWYQPAIHEEYVVAVIDSIIDNAAAVSELVLLGDVVDLWTYPFDVVPPVFSRITAMHPSIFGPTGALARVLDALDGAVTYVPGNHDMAVTEMDVAAITSPGGHRLRYAPQFYNPAGDRRLLVTHGHEFTLFNAPDHSTCWAPLPVGHFVTRIIATYWQSHLKPGQTVSDLKDQGYPGEIDFLSIIEHAAASADVSLSDALIDGIAGKLHLSESLPVRLPGGGSTTLHEVKRIYNSLFSRWIAENGGGEEGLLVATKAAMADYDASFMGWFAQREAFRRNAELVVLGHTHFSISKLRTSMVNYVNSGFMCPSKADMPGRFVSYAVVNRESPLVTKNMQAIKHEGGIAVNSFDAPAASIVVEPFMDFSCYVQIDNSRNTRDLLLVPDASVGNGHFVTLPESIRAGSFSTLWLQDYPNLVPPHGSDATVTYRDDGGTEAVFNFDCPTGVYSNSCSGGSSFQAKSGDGPWETPGKVPTKGHPLFVRFSVTPGMVGGLFEGVCGENSSARSSTGLQPGESVVLNGNRDLSGCIRANQGASVFGIRLDKVSGIYEYCLSVDAQGPKGLFSGSMYLYFTDQSGERYLLTIFDHKRKGHTVSYNSSAPAIMMIEWSNTAK